MPLAQTIFEIDELRKGIVVVRPVGDAPGFQGADISRDLKRVCDDIEARTEPKVILDLSRSAYYGSVMIGAFNVIGERAKKRGGTMVFCNASATMLEMLKVLHLVPRWFHFQTLKLAKTALKA